MARGNRTTHAILGFLTWGPMSGYEIRKRVEESIGNFWSESFGQIYPELRRLEAEGLIEPAGETDTGGRPRRTYAITDAGRAELGNWFEEPPQPMPVRNEMLLKLFFGGRPAPEAMIGHLTGYLARKREAAERYRGIEQSLKAEHSGHPDLPYWLMTLKLGQRQIAAEADWAEDTLIELRALPGAAPPPDTDWNEETQS